MDREKYINIQITRSESKFNYCKVSAFDVISYRDILNDANICGSIGPVICMGTRNGREVDLFRAIFYSFRFWSMLMAMLELSKPYPHSLLPLAEMYPVRSNCKNIDRSSVVGVEINPQAKRKDILIASFDDLPQEWTGRFGVLFSNSFDHSMDPERTVKEWIRVVRPGGVLIILWGDAESTETDLVGNISEQYLSGIFKLPKLNIDLPRSICGYNQVIFKRT